MNSTKITLTYFNRLLSLVLAGFLFSCEGFHDQVVPLNVTVNDVAPVLVINGWIEQDSTAVVQISYSEDIDASISTPRHYEANATVLLAADDGTSETFIYYGEGWYYGTTITGEIGKTYTMTIEIGEQTYSATSTMLPPPGYQDAWVVETSWGYAEEFIVIDPVQTRNRYLFEWWTNGSHIALRDWAIDDNRVVNANNGLRLFNVTTDPKPNEYLVFRAAEINKVCYDYFNMYEKIVRGIVNVGSQTPYNPTSNFGDGTIGNFRAVAFSSIVLLIPPTISLKGQNAQIELTFPLNKYFSKYNLYWNQTPGVTSESNLIADLEYTTSGDNTATYLHENLTYGAPYYYRMEVEDADGQVSILSFEVSAVADTTAPPAGNVPTNVMAAAGNGEITISWTPATGDPVHGIYWSNQPGITLSLPKEYQIWNSDFTSLISPYTHTGLTTGLTYYYRVAVWDEDEIRLSEEVSATVQ